MTITAYPNQSINFPFTQNFADMKNIKWRTILGLIMIYIAMFLNWNWAWGVLFLFWVIPDLFSGITYFMEPVERKENPILYWVIMVSWLGICAYMIAASFFPQVINYGYEMANPPSISTQSVGEYQPAPDNKIAVLPIAKTEEEKHKADKKSPEQKKPMVATSLDYKTYNQKEAEYFIGVSAETTFEKDLYLQHIEELWKYFYENDISPVIPNIVDEKIYVIYSDYDKPELGRFKITIGYRTSDVKEIYEGLTGIEIPASTFAVFESEKDHENFPTKMWPKVLESDLNRANTFDLVVYTLDKNYEVEKSELQIAIK